MSAAVIAGDESAGRDAVQEAFAKGKNLVGEFRMARIRITMIGTVSDLITG